MNATERLYVWLNNGTFVEKDGCTHPQDIIAAAIGCSERTVIRCVQQLEREGRLRVHRPRRRGACNTYYVACWNPARRSGVLNVLEAVRPAVLKRRRERDERLCQIKRTATALRAQTPPSAPSPRCTSLVDQRCGRESFEIRRLRMDQRRRHLHVADLTCLHCTEKDAELERVREMLRIQAEKQTALMEEVAGAQAAARATGKVLDQVTRDLAAQKTYVKSLQTRMANRVVTDEHVEEIIDYWCHHRPKTRREESFPEDGKRRKLIEAALKLMAGAEGGPVQACKEAIDGLHIAPWETYGRRSMQRDPREPKCQLKNRIEHCLGDETRIEKCRAIRKWAEGDGADRAWELCQVAGATYWALTEIVDEQIAVRRRGPVEPEVETVTVDGIRVRSDGR